MEMIQKILAYIITILSVAMIFLLIAFIGINTITIVFIFMFAIIAWVFFCYTMDNE